MSEVLLNDMNPSEATDEQISQVLSMPKEESAESVQAESAQTEQVETKDVETEVVSDQTTDKDGFSWDKTRYENKSAEDLLKELESRDKQIYHKESFIKRQANEVGEQRKMVAQMAINKQNLETELNQLKSQKENLYEDADIENNLKQQARVEDKLNNVNQQQKSILVESQIRSSYPNVDTLIKDTVPQIIREQMKLEGADAYTTEQTVNYFTTGQWKNAKENQVPLIASVFDKANFRSALIAKDLEIEQLRNGSKTVAQNVAQNIKKVAQHQPIRSSGIDTSNLVLTASELSEMSNEQLAEIGKKIGALK